MEYNNNRRVDQFPNDDEELELLYQVPPGTSKSTMKENVAPFRGANQFPNDDEELELLYQVPPGTSKSTMREHVPPFRGANQFPDDDEELELLYQVPPGTSKSTMKGHVPPLKAGNQFPNEDEEFELLYQQELEMAAETGQNKIQLDNSPGAISEFGGLSGILPSTVAKRRLFDTPGREKITSTPLAAAAAKCSNKDINGKQIDSGRDKCQQEPRTSKRKLDLFGGDFLPVDVSYVDPVAKKMRAEEERDLMEIEKILELRQKQSIYTVTTQSKKIEYLEKLKDFKMRNLSYTVPQWPFLSLQRSDQSRIYVRFHSADYENRALNDLTARPSMLVYTPEDKQQLWKDANEIILQRLESRTNDAQNIADAVPSDQIQPAEDNLWVEKYRPQKYIDLLSAEMTNRSLLFWLKMWDKVVFGKEFKAAASAAENAHKLNTFNKRTGKFESNGGWTNRRQRQLLNINTDEHGRPIQKVALLYGSPGLGKTTLAHILARHAGYQPIEINASDDRSPTSFQLALENGTQMTSVLNENGRPNCIILDEIDGAPKQSIEFLVKFVSDNVQVKRPKGSGGKGAKKHFLKRPIICICNDVYEPALRPLRQIAFVVQFPPVEIMRLEERLKQIAKIERMKADANALYTLALKTGNDIRCCISTMQFFKAENKPITLHEIIKSNVSRKDQHEGLFAIWAKIFQLERKTDNQQNKNIAEKQTKDLISSNDNSNIGRTQSILNAVQGAGDYQRLMQGVYENFLQQKMPDSSMFGIVQALDWFVFFDTVQHQINHQQNYTIYPYLPIGFVKWNFIFATSAWPNIKFPSKGYEFNQKSASQRHILDSLRKGLKSAPGVIGLGSGKGILLEAVPILKHILAPKIRHLPIEMFSQNEKDVLKHTIDVMIDLGLTYVQIKSLEGSYEFQMEPPLEMLLHFPGCSDVRLSYFNKQMIAREIEHERLRRAAALNAQKNDQTNHKENGNSKRKPVATNPAKAFKTKSPSNMLPKYFNYFRKDKNNIPNASSSTVTAAKSDPIVKSPIWFHYKEGFNNAVRKDISMKDLL